MMHVKNGRDPSFGYDLLYRVVYFILFLNRKSFKVNHFFYRIEVDHL